MSDTPPRPRYTLRDLPLPAKLVVSAFLLAVGLGYCSAMVQLHMQHSSKEGNPLPTPNDVVERFSGYKEFDGNFPKSKIETIISGDPHGGFNKSNMTPAFYGESDKAFKKVAALPKNDPKRKKVDAERDGERLAFIAFINAPADKRKAAFEADEFELPADVKGKPITEDMLVDGTAAADGKVKVKYLIGERCGRCHDKGQTPNFETFEQLEPLITAPLPQTYDGSGNPLPAPPGPGTPGEKVWVESGLKMSEEGLTQSTHAHLLSFAVLFALTGFVYAFTSHPAFVRGVLAPVVLVAQVADVSCWWLARLPLPYGPLFAQTIMATGAVVGLGLVLQIVLSLFNMYGVKGKVVLLLLFLAAGAGAYVVGDKVILRRLAEEKKRAAETRAASD